ncbi:MAG: hypothetical protein Q7J68_06170 [Thermoplasmata archaeon]|nr:hypothetical protein [Thermoplasmata archaeon]
MRNSNLKYLGAVFGIVGIIGTSGTLLSYVWSTRSVQYVNFNDYVPSLTIFGIIALVGILMYIFIDE